VVVFQLFLIEQIKVSKLIYQRELKPLPHPHPHPHRHPQSHPHPHPHPHRRFLEYLDNFLEHFTLA